MSLLERAETRLARELQHDPDQLRAGILREICDLAATRICLRVRTQTLPEILEPIAADIVVKLWRRLSYEGIASEGADKITTSFVEDILAEYEPDLEAYLDSVDQETGIRKIRFW